MQAAKIEIFKDRKGEWRLRVLAANGRILLVSSEGYKRRRSVENLTQYIASIPIVIVE
jgi:uncharacterized protein YegP (UPF0339 family)